MWQIARKKESAGKIKGLDLDDLFQLASLGYLKALKNYDPEKSKFITHLYMTAYYTVKHGIGNYSQTVMVSRHDSDRAMKILKLGLEEEKPEKIAEAIDISVTNAEIAIFILKQSAAADLSLFIENEELVTHQNFMVEDDWTAPHVEDFLKRLTARELRIVERLLQGYSQTEIAEIDQTSRQATSQHVMKIREKYLRFGA
nr:sigma-70 family RNA polymerase sigma factor [Alkalicoccus luteus]